MKILNHIISSLSFIKNWTDETQEQWLALRRMSFFRFFFATNIHIFTTLIFVGLQIATWAGLSYSELSGVLGLLKNVVIAVFLGVLLALILKFFTQLSYTRALKTKKLSR
ncbi:hypothetical protein ACFO4O_16995 [Glaciecola siphonariae]|uniref:Uncharacterized protein n=1 Tax=Glaciecola siphonariae TaxID=521012 RepID=A0ABV9M1B8_9ALTE